jgi:urea transport system substrate-binding protein
VATQFLPTNAWIKGDLVIRLILTSLMLSMLLSSCQTDNPIKVGVLHSKTGSLASSEQPVIDATLMAINDLNNNGGILGRRIEPIFKDGGSNPKLFQKHAISLLDEDGVSVLFGCWSSACRKAVKSVVESHNSLLFYPVQYEGLEMSRNIVYMGSTPNQQIFPAVNWASLYFGKRHYLVGTDFVFPRAANAQIRKQSIAIGTEIVGERYLPLGGQSVDALIADIVNTKPDVIINTLNGDTNFAFIRALEKVLPDMPVLSFSIAEPELNQLKGLDLTNHYAAWAYFQSFNTQENRKFLQKMNEYLGEDVPISSPMVNAYSAVNLWAKTFEHVKSDDPSTIRSGLSSQNIKSPSGDIRFSEMNNHTWKHLYIGQVNLNNQFNILWKSEEAIRPLTHPSGELVGYWERFLNDLYVGWGNQWAAPEQLEVSP